MADNITLHDHKYFAIGDALKAKTTLWESDEGKQTYGADYTFSDGLKVRAHLHTHPKDHLTFSGNYPNYGRRQRPYYVGQDAPSIDVSISRTPQQIAQDVENRLLPYLRPFYWEIVRSCEETTAKEIEAYDLVKELTGCDGMDRYRDDPPYEGRIYRQLDTARPRYVKVKSTYGDRVDMQLDDLSPDKARDILRLLGLYQETRNVPVIMDEEAQARQKEIDAME